VSIEQIRTHFVGHVQTLQTLVTGQ